LTKRKRVVVVDGSNLATEGRTIPSLRQLEEAVEAFVAEYPDYEPVVVVDATFEHRVAPAERDRVTQLDRTGEIVAPPAGTVGRGDAFILQIAKRANAVVLSNDSFQEFHAEHPWLFDEGRLVGGKPVPRVGWIFAPRNPVRGQKSRAGIKKAAALASGDSQPQPSETVASPRGSTRKAQATPATKSAKKAATAAKVVPPATKRSSAPPRATKRVARTEPAETKAAETKPAEAKTASSRRRAAPQPETRAAPVRPRPEPVNTPRSFLRLVTDHRVGQEVEGEVVQFTSHGAMVDVKVGKTMHVVCYAPLAGLSDPPPTRARDVLKKGSTHPFRIVAFDTERRRAELALVPA
jgi:hypothetical protein